MSGNLSFRPINAKLTHDTDTFSRMDPFVKAILGNQIQKSSVAKDAGKHPSWGDTLSFRRSTEDLLTIEVWDRDVGKDDLVGSVSIAVSTIQQKQKYSDWLQLSYKGKSAGQILCEFAWIPDGGHMGGFGGQTFGVQTTNTYPMQGMVQQTYTQPMYVQPTYTQPQTQPFVQPTYVQQQPQYIPQQQPQYIPQQQFIPQQQTQYIPQQQPQFIPQQQPQYIPQQQQQFIPQQQGYPQQGGYPQQQGGYPQQGGYYKH